MGVFAAAGADGEAAPSDGAIVVLGSVVTPCASAVAGEAAAIAAANAAACAATHPRLDHGRGAKSPGVRAAVLHHLIAVLHQLISVFLPLGLCSARPTNGASRNIAGLGLMLKMGLFSLRQ